MARFYFGARSPLGKVIQNGGDRYTIVGVVKDSRQRDLTAASTERRFYIPLWQTTDDITSLSFVVQTRGDAASALPIVRREAQERAGGLNITMVEAVRMLMRQSLSGERSVARLSGLFALLALLLAAAGLYGVISYATARRTNEIGLRMALGASRPRVMRLVLQEALTLTLAGLAIGLPGAWVILGVAAAGVVRTGSLDPFAFLMTTAALFTVAAAAAGVPAFRAARADPVIALRQE
jgi:ABC-type antimicrobial peptide transport system permease subunit